MGLDELPLVLKGRGAAWDGSMPLRDEDESICDLRFPEVPVVMDDGRGGGSPGSPAGPVNPGTALGVCPAVELRGFVSAFSSTGAVSVI